MENASDTDNLTDTNIIDRVIHDQIVHILIIFGVVILMLYGCGTANRNGSCPVKYALQKVSGEKTFNDPFSYCKCAGTIDTPDKKYQGERIPESMISSIKKKMGLTDDVTTDYIRDTTTWRCMDGKVLICMTGANLPCLEKADTRRIPTEAMNDFCKANPDLEYIPAVVTGRSTVYEWRCSGTKPVVVKQVSIPDKQGYRSDIWFELGAD
jgi:hypothetical protein